MFDILDVLVPTLATSPRIELSAETNSIAAPGELRVCIDGQRFARMMRADVAYSNLLPWTAAPGRESWSVLIVSTFANEAAKEDAAWDGFLNRLEWLLGLHETWLVTCESDCEQTDLEELTIAPSELTYLLDGYRRSNEHMSLRASSRPVTEELQARGS